MPVPAVSVSPLAASAAGPPSPDPMRTLPLISVLLLAAGCGAADAPAEASADGPSLSDVTVDASVEDDACGVLTPDLVAEAVGAPAGLDGNAFMSGMCVYTWGDDEDVASIAQLEVYDDAEEAARWFAQSTATMTRGDYRRGFEAIGDQVEAQAEDGEISADQAEGAGAFADALGESVAGDDAEVVSAYEPVTGIGDEAAIEEGEKTTEVMGMSVTDYVSVLWVRRGNAVFSVRTQVHDAAGNVDTGATARATRALGRAVSDRLSR